MRGFGFGSVLGHIWEGRQFRYELDDGLDWIGLDWIGMGSVNIISCDEDGGIKVN
jgi:hypothetical protein